MVYSSTKKTRVAKKNLNESACRCNICGASFNHFLAIRIAEANPKKYIKGDLYALSNQVACAVTQIGFDNETFDFVLCNHVHEHVPEIEKAFSEIYRVLKKGGKAILQTPYSSLISQNFEERNFTTDPERIIFFVQEDYVRVFAEKHFFELAAARELIAKPYTDASIKNTEIHKNDVNTKEPLLMFLKP